MLKTGAPSGAPAETILYYNPGQSIPGPTGVLLQFKTLCIIERNDGGAEGLEVFAFGEYTSFGTICSTSTIDVFSFVGVYVQELSIGSAGNVSTEDDVYVFGLGGVEELELVPADEVPVAVVLVEHHFATTETTDFPNHHCRQ